MTDGDVDGWGGDGWGAPVRAGYFYFTPYFAPRVANRQQAEWQEIITLRLHIARRGVEFLGSSRQLRRVLRMAARNQPT